MRIKIKQRADYGAGFNQRHNESNDDYYTDDKDYSEIPTCLCQNLNQKTKTTKNKQKCTHEQIIKCMRTCKILEIRLEIPMSISLRFLASFEFKAHKQTATRHLNISSRVRLRWNVKKS